MVANKKYIDPLKVPSQSHEGESGIGENRIKSVSARLGI